jgi:hypothetical protein
MEHALRLIAMHHREGRPVMATHVVYSGDSLFLQFRLAAGEPYSLDRLQGVVSPNRFHALEVSSSGRIDYGMEQPGPLQAVEIVRCLEALRLTNLHE